MRYINEITYLYRMINVYNIGDDLFEIVLISNNITRDWANCSI